MVKGVTLLEILMVMLIISMTLLFAFPAWQQTGEQVILSKEQHKLHLFLRQMQGRVENSTDIWFLVANRDLAKKQWCLTVQMRHDEVCDCLNASRCPGHVSPYFYYPYFPGKTMLISKKYYPQEISRFNGTRDTLSTVCFILQAGTSRTLFSLFNVGSVKLKDYQSSSACIND